MNGRHAFVLPERAKPFFLAWPTPGRPGGLIRFDRPYEWEAFVGAMAVDGRIPEIVRIKFARAQTLYLLGWVDPGLIKAGELAALIALELAASDRYGARLPKGKRTFADLLRYMVVHDGLDDASIPMVARSGGTAVGQLTGALRPTLADRRNALAHGDPFEGLPAGGLLELVRDLINYAYRGFVAEAEVET